LVGRKRDSEQDVDIERHNEERIANWGWLRNTSRNAGSRKISLEEASKGNLPV